MNSKRKAPPLDDDSCIEILLRLPIESVTRFQIVCKRWLSLISSDHFRRLHALRHHKPPECLILPPLKSSMFYFNLMTKSTKMIPFNINIPNHPKICSSCNGLLLLRDIHDCHVYNPITKQSRKISLQSTDSGKCTHVFRLHLVFDPSKSIHYKIICIRVPMPSPPDTQTYQMEVFDSESGTWNVGMEPFTDMESHESAAVVWELKGDDEWSLKYHHRLPREFGSRLLRFITETSTLLIYVPHGKIVAYSFLDTSYHELLDLKSQSKKPFLYRYYGKMVHYGRIHQFRETLAPV
ncbi:hypothetical protein ACS0TY_000306 [Phlomoides rotata]